MKGQTEWWVYAKSGRRPPDIPAHPELTYVDQGWAGWGDWLGTGNLAPSGRKYRLFDQARTFVQSLGLKSVEAWVAYSKSGKRPSDIPARPKDVYRSQGWVGFGDWLGTGRVATFNRKYRSFQQAHAFARSLRLKSWAEWQSYAKSGKLPPDIPRDPRNAYEDHGWAGMQDWLGTGYRPFPEARAFAQGLELRSTTEWVNYARAGRLPADIPSNPRSTYQGKGWVGMGDWLGTGAVAPKDRRFRPFDQARAFARSLKLKSRTEWLTYATSGKRPPDIPAEPWAIYRDRGWKDWPDWLGIPRMRKTENS